MPRVVQREAARRDLIEHFVYLAEHSSLDMAKRFLDNAESSFETLSRQPMMGSPVTLRHPALAGMRKWRIAGFDNHLVFYQPRQDGVSIVRILHAASDWWELLGLVTE